MQEADFNEIKWHVSCQNVMLVALLPALAHPLLYTLWTQVRR